MDFLSNVSAEVAGSVIFALVVAGWRARTALRSKAAPSPPAALPSTVQPSLVTPERSRTWMTTAKDILWGAVVAAVFIIVLGVSYWLLSIAVGAFISLVRKGTARIVAEWSAGSPGDARGRDGRDGGAREQ